MIQASVLIERLQKFVRETPDFEAAALISSDGLPISSILPAELEEEKTAAMSAAMLSLGEQIGKELARGTVERVLVEGEKGYTILFGCGTETVLLIFASKAAKEGLLSLAIKRLVVEIKTMLL